MNIQQLKAAIEEQTNKNIELYKIFQHKMHLDEMQPLIDEWRNGSDSLKAMVRELQELEVKDIQEEKINKTFVNNYGEATTRNITSSTYEREQRRLQKQIMQFI